MNDARIRIIRVVDPGEIGRQMEPKIEALMTAMGVRAQRLVPKRTWALHDSIAVSVAREGDVVVGTLGAGNEQVDYALEVERGTSRARAQPYLRPAFAQTTGADLNYRGKGLTAHGVVSFSTRRARVRGRRK